MDGKRETGSRSVRAEMGREEGPTRRHQNTEEVLVGRDRPFVEEF